MKQTLFYNIHDILKLTVAMNRKHLLKNLNSPFSFFETNEDIDTFGITFNIGKFLPSNNDCYVVDHKYHIKENYFYCKDSEGKLKWELEILGFEKGNTVINFDGKFHGPGFLISNLIAQEMLLMPVIMYKLGKKGYYLIHAGGVSKEGCAYVFAGRGGSFKTELVMDFVKSGFDYLGDDWVILHENQVLPFPKHFHAFTFSLKSGLLPTENSSTIMDKIGYIKYLRKDSNHDISGFKISDPSVLKALFFTVKGNKEKISESNMDLDKAIMRIIANNKAEMITSPCIIGKELSRYYNYMLAYSFVFTNSKVATYWDNLGMRIKETLKAVLRYEIEIPEKYNHNVFKEVFNVVSKKI